jgi:hypothetical protein
VRTTLGVAHEVKALLEAKQLAGPVDVLVPSLVQQMAEAIKADWGPGGTVI